LVPFRLRLLMALAGAVVPLVFDSVGSWSSILESCWRVMIELSARNSSSCSDSRVRLSVLMELCCGELDTYSFDGPE
jgi:hypothetical protein